MGLLQAGWYAPGPDGRRRSVVTPFARHRLRAAARDGRARDGRRGAPRLARRLCRHRPPPRSDPRHSALDRRRLHRLLARGIVNARVFETPRPVPGRLVPALAGSAVVALALPVFVAAGWPLRGWLLAATLWIAGELFALLLARLPLGTGNLAAAGMRGIGTSSRALLIGIPLAVTVADEAVGLAAAIVYALAFSIELAVSLVE